MNSPDLVKLAGAVGEAGDLSAKKTLADLEIGDIIVVKDGGQMRRGRVTWLGDATPGAKARNAQIQWLDSQPAEQPVAAVDYDIVLTEETFASFERPSKRPLI